MRLLMDIGNTRVKWALARGRALVDTGAASLADAAWPTRLPGRAVTAVHVASVGDGQILAALESWARGRGAPLYRVTTQARFATLRNGYTDPDQLGVDRWLACIGARAHNQASVLIADAGTALTLDWVGADGGHGGGLIAPGVACGRAALAAATLLRPADSGGAPAWLARNTRDAIASGTLLGAVALLDGAARELRPERLLLTGGQAGLLGPHLAHDWSIVAHLVLEGLAVYVADGSPAGHGARESAE